MSVIQGRESQSGAAAGTSWTAESAVPTVPDGIQVQELPRQRWLRAARLAGLLAEDVLVTWLFVGLVNGPLSRSTISATLLAPVLLALAGAYAFDWDRHRTVSARGSRLLFASIASIWIALAIGSSHELSSSLLVSALLPCIWLFARALARGVHAPATERVLIVGSAAGVEEVLAVSRRCVERMEIVGYVDDGATLANEFSARRRLGGTQDLEMVLASRAIDRVVIVGLREEALPAVLQLCDAGDITVDIGSAALSGASPHCRITFHNGIPLLRVRERRAPRWHHAAKRAFDLMAAAVGFAVFSPVFAIISALSLLSQGRPLFFRQARVGRHGREFQILKFRTMKVGTEGETSILASDVEAGLQSIADAVVGIKSAGASHVTRLGAFLRKTSLDELPQLWNVLRGDMSLVGPRPLRRFEHVALDSAVANERVRMRPGITGLWQVTGRSDVRWEERTYLDYAHVRNWSLRHDVEMLIETIPAMLKGR